jgi:hypothetical protein
MKRYTLTAIGAICAADYEYAKEANNGAWVFYEDVKKEFDKYRIEHSICEDMVEELQEVNKELLEAMKGLELYARDLLLLIDGGKAEMNFNLPKEITNAQAAIAKAKGYR